MRTAYASVVDDYVSSFADDLPQLPLDRRVLDTLANGVAPDAVVLDIGCGPGQLSGYLAAAGANVVGVDFTVPMLHVARQRVRGLRALAADVRALPVHDGAAGAIAMFYVLQHVPRNELPNTLAECRRVLRTGGLLALAVHEGAGEFEIGAVTGTLYTESELADRLDGSSFAIEAVDHRAPLPHERQGQRCYVVARATG